ncbi:MAG TPA: Tol-Pal system subunit TolQ [Desulfurella acetivorans]|uniref:Tol-Pal system subunit TolQ n=1 Tax=Desulfurella acetivorans TaxID=33002 RepID=A0A7C6A6A7_DESAE|nr:Tol-Pal system subunit TolQ [Desulfurella acetivorans]
MSSSIGFEHIGSVAIIVLGVLLIMSIISWTIIIYKWIQLSSLKTRNSVFLERFIDGESESTLNSFARINESLNAKIYMLSKQSLSVSKAYLIKEVNHLEKGFSILASVGATAPFVGLFGTIVGIINAFRDIGLSDSTSISVVAPGISEALIATAAGIFVAVVAVIGYNLLYSLYTSIIRETENFLEVIG